MKKLIAGLIAAVALAAGLMTISAGTPAFADCTKTAYNAASCAPTAVTKPAGVGTSPASAPVTHRTAKTIKVSFTSPTAKKGLIIINVFRGNKQVRSAWFAGTPSGEAVAAKLKGLKKGLYKVRVIVSPRGIKAAKVRQTYYFKVA